MSRIAIVVPLKEGAHTRVRTLLAEGPSFDPEAAGLERHDVYLTEYEAVLVFESETPAALEQLVADLGAWAAAAPWQSEIAGPPRIAEPAFSWIRSVPREYVSYAPTPGPGDSDGGDIFEP